MTLIYNVVFIFFSAFYLPYLVFTGRYHRDIWQRFGIYPKGALAALKGRDVIWIHAVSVGEVMAIRTLCETIIAKYPEKKLVVSTITKTGNDVANRYLKDRATIVYLPVDLSWIVNKVISAIGPSIFIIVETELWPNLITALSKRGVPVLLVNGRISPSSYKYYMKIRPIFKGMLEKMTLFCMQNEEYAKRIKVMGAPADRVVVTGSVKFDAAAGSYAQSKMSKDPIRRELGLREGERLLIAGSTHRPEESIVLDIYKDLIKTSPGLRLLIAPRHIGRAHEIEALVEKAGFTAVRVSGVDRMANVNIETPPVIILDTMGRLSQIFSIGTVIFIGGSLMRKGGQNILEPAIFSKAILFGPHMFNFKDIANEFISEGAARMVKDKADLFENVERLLRDGPERELMGERARALMDRNMGATGRTMAHLEGAFSRSRRA